MVNHNRKPLGRRRPSHPIDRGWSWVVCLSCCVIKFLLNGFWNSIGLFFVHWERDFDADGSSVAIIGSIIISQWLLGVIAEPIAKKITHRTTLFISGLIVGVSLFASTFISSNIWLMYIAMAFTAIGLGIAWFISGCYNVYYFEAKLGVANSLVVTFMGAGTLVVPIFVQMSLDEYGWRGTYVLMSAVMCNISTCALQLRPTESSTTNNYQKADFIHIHKEPSTSLCTRLKELIVSLTTSFHLNLFCKNSLPFMSICFLSLTFGTAFSSVYIYVAPHATAVGVSEMKSAFLLPLIGIFGLFLRLTAGFMVDRNIITSWNLCGLGLVICAISCVLMPIFNSYLYLATISSVFGLSNGLVEGLNLLVIRDFVGIEDTTGSFAWGLALWAVGGVISVYLGGFLYDKFSSYNFTFIIAGCFLFGAAVVVFARNGIHNLQWRLENRGCDGTETSSGGSGSNGSSGSSDSYRNKRAKARLCCFASDNALEIDDCKPAESINGMKGPYGLLKDCDIITALPSNPTKALQLSRETCV